MHKEVHNTPITNIFDEQTEKSYSIFDEKKASRFLSINNDDEYE